MIGHPRCADGRTWVGLEPIELHYVTLILKEADISFLPDHFHHRIDELARKFARLERREIVEE